MRENAVDDFVGRPVSADGQEATITLRVRLSGQLGDVARAGRGNHVNAEPLPFEPGKLLSSKLCRTPATRRGIHNGEKLFVHVNSVVRILPVSTLKRQNHLIPVKLAEALGKRHTNDFQGSSERKVIGINNDAVNTFVVNEAVVSRGDFKAERVGESLP